MEIWLLWVCGSLFQLFLFIFFRLGWHANARHKIRLVRWCRCRLVSNVYDVRTLVYVRTIRRLLFFVWGLAIVRMKSFFRDLFLTVWWMTVNIQIKSYGYVQKRGWIYEVNQWWTADCNSYIDRYNIVQFNIANLCAKHLLKT